jgi:hypothetical protein
MTLAEFQGKYGTEGFGLLIDSLFARIESHPVATNVIGEPLLNLVKEMTDDMKSVVEIQKE